LAHEDEEEEKPVCKGGQRMTMTMREEGEERKGRQWIGVGDG